MSWQDDDRSEITIHNLLQMNSGLEWIEDYNNMSDVTKNAFFSNIIWVKCKKNKQFVGIPDMKHGIIRQALPIYCQIFQNIILTQTRLIWNFWYS